MKNIYIPLILFLVLNQLSATESNTLPTIVTTIAPYRYIIHQINPELPIEILLPKNANPHFYEPLPHQLSQLEKAQYLLMTGSHIELEIEWVPKLKRIHPLLTVLNTGENLKSISNPHVWISLSHLKIISETITQQLNQIFPHQTETHLAHLKTWLDKIDTLENQYRRFFQSHEIDLALSEHDDLIYLFQDLHIPYASIENEGHHPTPQTIGQLISKTKNKIVPFIITPNPKNSPLAKTVAKEIHATLIFFNPIEEDLFNNLNQLLKNIQNAYENYS